MTKINPHKSEPKIEIYTSMLCSYCAMAKRILTSKDAPFTEIDITADKAQRLAMQDRAGGRHSVPQIFINDFHVGGCDDLNALERSGKLDQLLSN